MALKIRGNTQILGGSVHNEQLAEANVSLSKLAVITDLDANGNAQNQISIAAGKELRFMSDGVDAMKIHADGTVTVAGNLNVTGAVNSVSTSDLLVEDFTITVAKDASDATSAGIKFGDSGLGISFTFDGANFSSTQDISAADSVSGRSATNYLTGTVGLFAADVALDSQIKANETAISTETSNRIAQDDKIEASAGLNADGSYVSHSGSNYMDSAVSLHGADVLLDAALKAEESARGAADLTLQGNINTEQSDRIAQDDKIEASAGLNADGSYVAHSGSNYMDSAASLHGADILLDAALKAEESARGAADITLQGNINTETSNRIAQDDVIEASAGLNADGSYAGHSGSNYMDSAASLHGADILLDAALKAEETARIAADGTLQSNINTETSNRIAQDDKIEAAAGLSADGDYVADASSNYLDSAVSLFDADMKLDAALFDLSQNISSGAITGAALQVKMGIGDGTGLMATVTRHSQVKTVEAADSAGGEVSFSFDLTYEVPLNIHSSVMVFVNGQKLTASNYGIANANNVTTITMDPSTVGSTHVDVETDDVIEVVYYYVAP